MTDMIDITAHNADPILLHLFIFHKKLVHTLLLLFLCGNIYPLTLMIDFHYSKSCCFNRFFYFVFLKINDAGSDKIPPCFNLAGMTGAMAMITGAKIFATTISYSSVPTFS